MNVLLPIIAYVVGVWCGFGIACLLIAANEQPPGPTESEK